MQKQKQVARKRLPTSLPTKKSKQQKKKSTTHRFLITPPATAPLESSPPRLDLPSHCKRRVFHLNNCHKSRNPKRKQRPLNPPLHQNHHFRNLRRPPSEPRRQTLHLLKTHGIVHLKLPPKGPVSTSLSSLNPQRQPTNPLRHQATVYRFAAIRRTCKPTGITKSTKASRWSRRRWRSSCDDLYYISSFGSKRLCG